MLGIIKFQCYLIYFQQKQEFYHAFSFCYLLFSVIFFIISVVKKKIKVKPSPAIPTRAPTILTEETIQTPPPLALKTIKILSM